MTEAEVLELQEKWGGAIKTISKTYLEKGDYVGAAGNAAAELYGYGHGSVLFKPTKAAEFPFRPSGGEAMSYFVGGSAVEDGYAEDAGFAINGGKGWKEVAFTNHGIELLGTAAIAMGTYIFTCATTGDKARVEYTFGYRRNDDGKARIFLHHSSVPYAADKAAPKAAGRPQPSGVAEPEPAPLKQKLTVSVDSPAGQTRLARFKEEGIERVAAAKPPTIVSAGWADVPSVQRVAE